MGFQPLILPDSCKTDTGKPSFKASEGGCFENLRVSEDITPSEFQQGKGTKVPIRPKVRLEAFPNGLPMSVSSKVYATLRFPNEKSMGSLNGSRRHQN
jgi:hypothetical protein